MDSFSKTLRQENLAKKASADLKAFYRQLPLADLMELAGVKVAVAGPATPVTPTGAAASEAKVTATAPAKKTTQPELPVAKEAGIAGLTPVGKSILRGAGKGAVIGGASGLAAGSIADLANKDDDNYGKRNGLKKGIIYGAVLGGASRAAKYMPKTVVHTGHTKLNQARFLKMAMRVANEAPENIRQAAIKLAGPTITKIPALGLNEKVPFPGQFDEFDAEEKSFARQMAQGTHPLQGGSQPQAALPRAAQATNATVASKPGVRGMKPLAAAGAGQGLKARALQAGQQLKAGWGDMSTSLAHSTPRFMARPEMAMRALKSQSVPMAARVGRAARMVLPHAGLLGGGLLAMHAMSNKNSQAVKTGAAILLEKQAKVLTVARREKLPTKDFAIPAKKAKAMGTENKIVGKSEGRYPVNDRVHARAALSMVAKHGTEEEKSMVRAKVHAKYPDMKKSAGYDHEGG